MSAALRPSRSDKTSPVCWPSAGGPIALVSLSGPNRIGEATDGTAPTRCVRQRAREAARRHLRIVEHVGDGVDRPGGDAGPGEARKPVLCRSLLEHAGDERDQDGAVGDARRIGREARVAAHSGMAGDVRKGGELRVVADGDDDVAVGRRERLVGHDVRMRVAEPPRRDCPRPGSSSPGWRASRPGSRAAPCRCAGPRRCARAPAARPGWRSSRTGRSRCRRRRRRPSCGPPPGRRRWPVMLISRPCPGS